MLLYCCSVGVLEEFGENVFKVHWDVTIFRKKKD